MTARLVGLSASTGEQTSWLLLDHALDRTTEPQLYDWQKEGL